MTKIIELTDGQLCELAPEFDALAIMAKKGRPGMLIAQIFQDGMKVAVVSQDIGRAMRAALGKTGDVEPTNSVYGNNPAETNSIN